ncbi:MAG: NeuD/PglB/VioB family sugar acetyltransferase [Candidatus Micrarchaeaceae archaeon]
MVKYYIVGAGGQARQVLSIARRVTPSISVTGFIGLENEKGRYINNVEVVTESDIGHLDRKEVLLLNGLGRPNRKDVIERLLSSGFVFSSLIHPASDIGDYVSVGSGTIIQSGVGITTNVELGRFILIDLNATIGHDVSIGNYTTISTGVNIAGGVSIGEGCWIGSGSTIIEGISIGNNTLIGAGSVVTRDIGDNKLAYGVPAKVVREISDVSYELIRE